MNHTKWVQMILTDLQYSQNMMKQIICDYLKNILIGDPKLVEAQEQEMATNGQKLHYRKDIVMSIIMPIAKLNRFISC